MTRSEMMTLLQETGEPCVSIIIPMHRLSPDRMMDPSVVKAAVDNAKAYLKEKYADREAEVDALIQKIEMVTESIDYAHSKNAIGVYVSKNRASLIEFPFPVTAKIRAGEKFDSRDLLYYVQTMTSYYVLSISKKHINLFKGEGEELREVKNDDFPVIYEETYEYSKPVRGTSFSSNSLKEFEKDKSIMQEIRLKSLLKSVDHLLEKYINSTLPLIVAGGKKEISDFLQVTRFEKRIAGKVTGNYHFNGDQQLAAHSWETMQSFMNKQNAQLLSELQELVGKEMAAIGLEEVWLAANEGNGLELFVEKDYAHRGYIVDNGFSLKIRKPGTKKDYVYTEDAVELIINKVLEKKGKVVFTNNGEMKNFDGIALQLRYTSAH